jgi:hypothetical protein
VSNLHPIFEDILTPFMTPGKGSIEMEAYRAALQKHDWWYEMSDDWSVWRDGKNRREQLESLQRILDPDLTVWNSIAPEEQRKTA